MFLKVQGLNLPKDLNILASVTHVQESAGGSFFIGLAAAISEFKCLIKIQLKSRVLKIFDWVKTGLVRLDLRKVNYTAFFIFCL